MSYTKLAVRGAAIVFVISILSAFLGYIVRLILARNLSLEEFGLFYAVFSFLALISLFKTLGYDKSLIKFIPEFQHANRKDFIKSSIIYVSILQVITNIIILALIYVLANYLSIHFFHEPKAAKILLLMAIAFFIDSFVLVLKFSLQGFQKMTLFSSLDFIRMLLIVIITLIGFKLNYELLSPVFAYILTPLILILIFGFILVKKIFPDFFKANFIIDMNLIKKISKYSFFVMATGSAALILQYTDTTMLTYFTGLEAVALYNIAFPISKILTYIPNAIGGVLLPLSSELWTKEKKEILRVGIESLYKYSMILIIPLVFVMVSFSDFIIAILFGKQYILAANAMRILVIGTIFLTLHLINIFFISGIGHPEVHTKIVYAAAIFNFIGNLILIPMIGIIGAAITTAVSYFIMMAIGFMKIRKFIDITFPIKIWIKTFVAGILFTAIIYLLKNLLVLNVWIETFIVLSLAGVLYCGLLLILKIITINELKDLYIRILK